MWHNMEELNTNLFEAANYFIQLFYRTGKVFSCTRTKIGKLLSIVAFSYAREDKLFLNEKIYKYDGCGTIINELEAHIDREVYLQCTYNNSKQSYTQQIDETSHIVDLAKKYQKIDSLTPNVKERIKKIFCRFCAYSPSELGQCICPIVNHPEIEKKTEKSILWSY